MQSPAAITIEPASPRDAGEIAALYLASRTEALPYLRRCHSDQEIRDWIEAVRLITGETWVAREAGRILGFLCLDGEELDQLYILPEHFRRGIGSRLLAKAKERSPARLGLFTFQRNAAARAFYERHGFRLVSTTASAMRKASRTRATSGADLSRPGACNREAPFPFQCHDDVEGVPQLSSVREDGHEPNV